MRIDQMRIDQLVDKFLLKDSQSNIQLNTSAGLDFTLELSMQQVTLRDDPKKNKNANTSSNKKQKGSFSGNVASRAGGV